MPQRRLLDTVAEGELEQAPKSVLVGLHLLNLRQPLKRFPARNARVENRAPQDLVSVEPTALSKRFELLDVLVGKTNRDSMLEPFRSPHTKIINIAIALSSKNMTSDARISRRR